MKEARMTSLNAFGRMIGVVRHKPNKRNNQKEQNAGMKVSRVMQSEENEVMHFQRPDAIASM
jgi:hypothetical protein